LCIYRVRVALERLRDLSLRPALFQQLQGHASVRTRDAKLHRDLRLRGANQAPAPLRTRSILLPSMKISSGGHFGQ
jgi:hypothetical protein